MDFDLETRGAKPQKGKNKTGDITKLKVPKGNSKVDSKASRTRSLSEDVPIDVDDGGKETCQDEEEDDEVEEGGNDGFATVMSKILNQPIQKKVPVLAKRKTTVMKEIETERENRDRLKKLRMKRKAERDRQIVLPSVLQNDYERQLKKVATRGVIALFNAIAQTKRELDGDEDDGKYKGAVEGNKRQIADIKDMTQSKFIELLTKTSASEKPSKKRGEEEPGFYLNSSASI